MGARRDKQPKVGEAFSDLSKYSLPINDVIKYVKNITNLFVRLQMTSDV